MRGRLPWPCWIFAVWALVAGCTQESIPALSPVASRTVDYAAMKTAIEDKITSGSLSLSTINAVLVSVGGKTKLADYRNGSRPEDALHVWSVTKSVVSALIGIAIDEKIISRLNATVLELLPRYQGLGYGCGGPEHRLLSIASQTGRHDQVRPSSTSVVGSGTARRSCPQDGSSRR